MADLFSLFEFGRRVSQLPACGETRVNITRKKIHDKKSKLLH